MPLVRRVRRGAQFDPLVRVPGGKPLELALQQAGFGTDAAARDRERCIRLAIAGGARGEHRQDAGNGEAVHPVAIRGEVNVACT